MEHWTIGTLNGIDISMLMVVGLSTAIGIVRGFAKESMSLVTWIAASVVSVLYFQRVGDAYLSGIQLVMLRYLLSALLLSLGTLILGGIINYLISALIQKTGFSMPDRIIGTLFGCVRGMLLVVVGVLITLSFPKLQTPIWRNSVLIPFFVPSALWLKEQIHIPESLKTVLESSPQVFSLPKIGPEASKKQAPKKEDAAIADNATRNAPAHDDQTMHHELDDLEKRLKPAS